MTLALVRRPAVIALCILAACSDNSEPNPLATVEPTLAKGRPTFPTADAGGPYQGTIGAPIQFDGRGSSHPSTSNLTYIWHFGDGTKATGPTPTHTFWEVGTHEVKLFVTANGKQRRMSKTTVRVDPVPDAGSDPVVLVKDDFSRVLTSGWGEADVGGPWRLSSGREGDFSVNGSAGQISKSDALPRNAVATAGYGRDVTGIASFSIGPLPDAQSFYTVEVYARRDDSPGKGDGNYHYRYRVRSHQDGTMDLRIEKTVGGASSFLTTANIPISVVWAPGAKYWIRWECIGASPETRLRMRVWKDGTAEPSDWQIDLTHDEPALDAPGTTGFRVSGPNTGQTTWPVTFTLDDLEYVGV